MSKDAIPEAAAAEVAACQQAAADCAHVIKGFTHINVEDLFKSTRGAAQEAFPRQLLMAGLVSELGFSSLTVGRAVGRDKATVEHACRIVEALRGDSDAAYFVKLLGEDAVREFLGGADLVVRYERDDDRKKEPIIVRGGAAVEKFLSAAEALVDDMFAAFRLVAVQGGAYRATVEELRRDAAAPKVAGRAI